MNISRRGFLGWVAAGASGLIIPELIKPKAKAVVFDMGRKFKVEGCVTVPSVWVRIVNEPVAGGWNRRLILTEDPNDSYLGVIPADDMDVAIQKALRFNELVIRSFSQPLSCSRVDTTAKVGSVDIFS